MCRRGLGATPRHLRGLLALGRALFGLGKLKDASEALRHAQQLEPQEPEVYRLLGEVMLRRGTFSEVLALLRRAADRGISDDRLRALAERTNRAIEAQETTVAERGRGMGNVAIAGTIGGTQDYDLAEIVPMDEPEDELFPTRGEATPVRTLALEAFPEAAPARRRPARVGWGELGRQWEERLDDEVGQRVLTDPETPVRVADVEPVPLSDPLAEGIPPIPEETRELATGAYLYTGGYSTTDVFAGLPDGPGALSEDSPTNEASRLPRESLGGGARAEAEDSSESIFPTATIETEHFDDEDDDEGDQALTRPLPQVPEEGVGHLEARGVSREPKEIGRWGQGSAEKPLDGPPSPVQEFRSRHLGASSELIDESATVTQPLEEMEPQEELEASVTAYEESGVEDPWLDRGQKPPWGRRSQLGLALALVFLAVALTGAFLLWKQRRAASALGQGDQLVLRALRVGTPSALAQAARALEQRSAAAGAARLGLETRGQLVRALARLWGGTASFSQGPRSQATRLVRAIELIAAGRVAEGGSALAQGDAASAGMPAGLLPLLQAELAWRRGALDEASRYAAEARAADPQLANGVLLAAKIAFALGDEANAKTLATQVLAMSPQHPAALGLSAFLGDAAARGKVLAAGASIPEVEGWRGLFAAIEGKQPLAPKEGLGRVVAVAWARELGRRCEGAAALRVLESIASGPQDQLVAVLRAELQWRGGLAAEAAASFGAIKALAPQLRGRQLLARLVAGHSPGPSASSALPNTPTAPANDALLVAWERAMGTDARSRQQALVALTSMGSRGRIGAAFAQRKAASKARLSLLGDPPLAPRRTSALALYAAALRARLLAESVPSQALAYASRIDAACPGFAAAGAVRGGVLLRYGRYQEAMKLLLALFQAGSREPGVLAGLVRAWAETGQRARAAAFAQREGRASMKRAEGWLAQGTMRLYAAQHDKAAQAATIGLTYLERRERDEVLRAELLRLRGRAMQRSAQPARAIEAFGACAMLASCRVALAEMLIAGGARPALGRAGALLSAVEREGRKVLAPRLLARAALGRARIALRRQKVALARGAAAEAVARDPLWWAGHRLLGEVELTLRHRSAARRALESAAQLKPKDPDVWWLLGEACRDDTVASRKAYRQFLRLEQRGPRARRARVVLRRLR